MIISAEPSAGIEMHLTCMDVVSGTHTATAPPTLSHESVARRLTAKPTISTATELIPWGPETMRENRAPADGEPIELSKSWTALVDEFRALIFRPHQREQRKEFIPGYTEHDGTARLKFRTRLADPNF